MVKFLYEIYGFLLNLINHISFLFHNFFNLPNILPKKKLLKLEDINSDKIVIFGSSKSLLKLTSADKKILKNLPKVFMNKNLIYWKKINLWPEFYFLLDTPIKSSPVKNIFFDTIKILSKTNKILPILFLERFYRFYVPKGINKIYFRFNKSRSLKWANKIDENLFGSHGSITSLLNIIYLLKKFKHIILVGVDFNKSGYFFSKKHKNYFKYIDIKSDKLETKKKIHSNLIKVGKINVLTHWHLINKNLKNKKIKLYCASKNSELVKKGLVKYLSIKKFNKI